MNKYSSANRKRRQTLMVVEGHHEKNELFWLIFRCFPELKIRMDDVWIYGTNIYTLYEDIASPDMYGPDWAENGEDIDLPFVISKKIFPEKVRHKEEFTNIILVFDYERHDPKFSEEKIMQMQRYFRDAADMGQLYINYPMIESYQHLQALPDVGYMERRIPVSLQPGKKYKELVAKDSVIKDLVRLPHKINDLFRADLDIEDQDIRNTCRDEILELSEENDIAEHLQNILTGVISEEHVRTITYRLKDWVIKAEYLQWKES